MGRMGLVSRGRTVVLLGYGRLRVRGYGSRLRNLFLILVFFLLYRLLLGCFRVSP